MSSERKVLQHKVIPCKWFPFKPYSAITLYKWIIVRKDYLEKVKGTNVWLELLNHEKIHLAQIQELIELRGSTFLGVMNFYLLYVGYFLKLWLFTKRKWDAAYRDIPFEFEAYSFDYDLSYLGRREPFRWKKYI